MVARADQHAREARVTGGVGSFASAQKCFSRPADQGATMQGAGGDATVSREYIRRSGRYIRNRLVSKSRSELSFWKRMLRADGGRFRNSWYERLMLAIAEEDTADFVNGKIIADFGCGPRGSLAWANGALVRIGIDVLADRYAEEFTDNILSHGMVYLKSTESVIPLPSGLVDVIFTLNAMDHVDDFGAVCDEVVRVLKPGGEFVGSLNLEQPSSPAEPQRLTEQIIENELLSRLEIKSYRLARRGPDEDVYAPFFYGTQSYTHGQEGILWVRARKPR